MLCTHPCPPALILRAYLQFQDLILRTYSDPMHLEWRGKLAMHVGTRADVNSRVCDGLFIS